MKKTLLTTTLLMTFASASAFAHHPAADMVDPETYAMISENLADTPHADMILGDMGAEMDDGLCLDAQGEMGEMAREEHSRAPEHAPQHMYTESQGDADLDMDAGEEVDTIVMLDDVTSALAE